MTKKLRSSQPKKIQPIAPPPDLRGKDFCLPDDCSDLGLFEFEPTEPANWRCAQDWAYDLRGALTGELQ